MIFTTCDCATNDKLFEKMTYPAVVIDEAAQAVEQLVWSLLTKSDPGDCRQREPSVSIRLLV